MAYTLCYTEIKPEDRQGKFFLVISSPWSIFITSQIPFFQIQIHRPIIIVKFIYIWFWLKNIEQDNFIFTHYSIIHLCLSWKYKTTYQLSGFFQCSILLSLLLFGIIFCLYFIFISTIRILSRWFYFFCFFFRLLKKEFVFFVNMSGYRITLLFL